MNKDTRHTLEDTLALFYYVESVRKRFLIRVLILFGLLPVWGVLYRLFDIENTLMVMVSCALFAFGGYYIRRGMECYNDLSKVAVSVKYAIEVYKHFNWKHSAGLNKGYYERCYTRVHDWLSMWDHDYQRGLKRHRKKAEDLVDKYHLKYTEGLGSLHDSALSSDPEFRRIANHTKYMPQTPMKANFKHM